MKKIFTIVILITSLFIGYAQTPPIIEGTYFPVKNTSIKQVWDITPGSLSVPTIGPNQVWDYRFSNNQFTNIIDTFRFKMLDPISTPFKQYFPNATHASFVRTPLNNVSDSLYTYFKINNNGLFSIGGFNIKKEFDSTIINSKDEFYSPSVINYGVTYIDTSRYIGYAKNYDYLGTKYVVKIKGRKIKTTSYNGYGTLKLPNGTYNNTAVFKETNAIIDSIFVYLSNNFTFLTKSTSSANVYHFFRNNTFGSNYLMYLSANPQNTQVAYGWYTLPVDIGTISGTVFTNTLETTPVTNGKAYLYRENSNFAKNDILAKSNLDVSGNYKFDSIPYGEYRIAIRPDTAFYPYSKITYFGDTTNWLDAPSIITTTTTSIGHKIHLQYTGVPSGANYISGQLGLDLSIFRTSGILAAKKIPGIGVVIKKNPGSSAERVMVTDTAGKFVIGNLNDGDYKVFVDIPGLYHAGTYNFSVSGGSIVNGLDFTVGTDSIHPNNTLAIGIKETKNNQQSFLSVYPNPYTSFATVVLNIPNTTNVLLEVYNVLGQKVQTLDNSQKQTGNYKYSFSAKNLNLSTGMYFVKLTAGNITNVIKIIEQ